MESFMFYVIKRLLKILKNNEISSANDISLRIIFTIEHLNEKLSR